MSRVCPAGPAISHLVCQTLSKYTTCKLFNHFFFIHGVVIGAIDLCHFIPLSLTLTLVESHKVSAWLHFLSHFWSDCARKQKLMRQFFSQSFQSVWMEFGMLLRRVGMINLVLILSCPFSIQGRKLYLCYVIKRTSALACIQIFTNQFVSNLVRG